jgi:hypothetical protein
MLFDYLDNKIDWDLFKSNSEDDNSYLYDTNDIPTIDRDIILAECNVSSDSESEDEQPTYIPPKSVEPIIIKKEIDTDIESIESIESEEPDEESDEESEETDEESDEESEEESDEETDEETDEESDDETDEEPDEETDKE